MQQVIVPGFSGNQRGRISSSAPRLDVDMSSQPVCAKNRYYTYLKTHGSHQVCLSGVTAVHLEGKNRETLPERIGKHRMPSLVMSRPTTEGKCPQL